MAEFGSLVTFDKRFNGVDKSLQTRIASFYHVSAEELKSFAVEDGDVKLLSTGQFDGFTTENIAGDVINSGEVICIPTGGAANLKYYKGKFVDSGNILAVAKNDSVCLKYVFYGLKYKQAEVDFYFRGASIKHPQMADIWKITIPTKPTEIQQSIVQELDTITDVLSKKREQLKELDKLAQSIFYDMFGDPVTNEKGWEEKKLSDLITMKAITYHLDGNHGGDYPRAEEFVSSGIPYISANCIHDNLIDMSMAKYLTAERAAKLRKGISQNNDVLFAHNATVGPVALLRTTEQTVILSTSLTAYRCNPNLLEPLFLRAYMISSWFVSQYMNTMKQSTRNQIPITRQKNFLFILPPLPLQQAFAEKIEKIEQMKENLKASIKETETLLESRMNYWFE